MGILARIIPGLSHIAFGPAHRAAGTGRRTRSWVSSSSDVNAIIRDDIVALRERSRLVARDNDWASAAVDRLTSEIVGTGITPRSLHPDKVTQKKITALWKTWSKESDSSGVLDFNGQQMLAVSTMIIGGEVILRLRTRRSTDRLTVPFQIQLLEGDHLPAHKNEIRQRSVGSPVRRIESGIEFNSLGAPIAYHLTKSHPDSFARSVDGIDTIPVPARDIAHVFLPKRAGQIRGVPWLTPSLVRLLDLGSYEDAELQRKGTTALFAAFVENSPPEFANQPLPTDEKNPDDDDETISGLEPATVTYLAVNEKVVFAEPTDVGGNFEIYLQWHLRAIAAGLGLTYENFTGDYRNVPFSAIRGGLIAFRRRITQLQTSIVIFQLCRPVWNRFITDAVLSGALPDAERAFINRPQDFFACEWKPPRFDWVDPLKSVRADILALKAKLKSRSSIINEMGGSAEELDEQIKKDRDREKELGIEDENSMFSDDTSSVGDNQPVNSGAHADVPIAPNVTH